MMLADTSAEARAVQLAAYRSMTTEQRASSGVALSEEARQILLEGVRRRNPNFDAKRVQFEYLRMVYGDEFGHELAAYLET